MDSEICPVPLLHSQVEIGAEMKAKMTCSGNGTSRKIFSDLAWPLNFPEPRGVDRKTAKA